MDDEDEDNDDDDDDDDNDDDNDDDDDDDCNHRLPSPRERFIPPSKVHFPPTSVPSHLSS